jgi:DNA helicase-2/ATP-dependent DNA helicase PcrA
MDQNKIYLNKQQYLASLPDRGINLVIAGAGTGKTKTLIEKVKNIITEGIAEPGKILLLTFSNKAAEEIKERVKQSIGKAADKITSGTFHSFCLRFLRDNSRSFISSHGFNKFPDVIDDDKRASVQRELLIPMFDRFLGLPVDVITGLAESYDKLDKKTFKKLKHLRVIKELDSFNRKYKEHKILNNLIDFSDMMNYTIDILEKNISIREDTIKRFDYLLVDEFQDTSDDNFRLIKLLLNERSPNLFLVGDDWQSIYGFRGSRIEYLVNMKKYFPDVNTHKLIINYRSKKELVSLSNRFIEKNKKRTNKRLRSFRGKGGMIGDYFAEGYKEEGDIVADIIKKEINNHNHGHNGTAGIAVLYRNNWQKGHLFRALEPDGLQDSVQFMTMHSSKGLEFDTVIITGISDDIIPDVSNDIEEERRLFYVALTRARDRLYLVHHGSPDGGLSIFAEELGIKGNKEKLMLLYKE